MRFLEKKDRGPRTLEPVLWRHSRQQPLPSGSPTLDATLEGSSSLERGHTPAWGCLLGKALIFLVH